MCASRWGSKTLKISKPIWIKRCARRKCNAIIYILTLCGSALVLQAQPSPGYTGSVVCKACHPALFERWRKTRMANVVRDPRAFPDAILPDLSKPDPLVPFKAQDIAFVYGSKWKQRYFTRI